MHAHADDHILLKSTPHDMCRLNCIMIKILPFGEHFFYGCVHYRMWVKSIALSDFVSLYSRLESPLDTINTKAYDNMPEGYLTALTYNDKFFKQVYAPIKIIRSIQELF